MLDALLAAEELPEEYRDRCQVVQFSSPLFFIVSTIRVFIYLFLLHVLSRISFVTTVRRKGNVDSIGCTTNAAHVARTIPALSRLTQQIAQHQASGRGYFSLSPLL
jgi:zinc finger-like protein